MRSSDSRLAASSAAFALRALALASGATLAASAMPAWAEAGSAPAAEAAAQARPPIEQADAWLAALAPDGTRRVKARLLRLAATPMFRKEGDEEPYEYRLYPPNLPTPPQGDTWALKAHHHWAYIDEPDPAVRWMAQTWPLAALSARWGQDGAAGWSWQDVRASVLDNGRQQWLCFDAPYSGLGASGLSQFVRAVLVVSPIRPRQELFWSGLLASCDRLAQDQARRWVYVDARPAGALWQAQAWRVDAPGKRTALQAWQLGTPGVTPAAGAALAPSVAATAASGPATARAGAATRPGR